MSEEQVLFDDRQINITVTNERLIIGDDVIGVDTLSHAGYASLDGFKEYAMAVLFGVVGIGFVVSFSWWSILGLCLLAVPISIFMHKKKWWVFIYNRGGGSIEEQGSSKRMYTKETAKSMTDAINSAIQAYKDANDPRSNLNV